MEVAFLQFANMPKSTHSNSGATVPASSAGTARNWNNNKTSSSAIAERARCRVGYKWKTGTGRQCLRIVYLQPMWRNWPAKQSNSVKKRKIRAIRRSRSFKVIEVGINRKPVCDFLLVINSNWHPISYRFRVIVAYCSNFGHFVFSATVWRLREKARCSSWAQCKVRTGLPISVNWTFFRYV